MSRARQLLGKMPAWIALYNRKYQVDAVSRMVDLLNEKGLSQKEVAVKAGWTQSYLSRVLSGRQNLTLKTVARFEAAVGGHVLTVYKSRAQQSEKTEFVWKRPVETIKRSTSDPVSRSAEKVVANWGVVDVGDSYEVYGIRLVASRERIRRGVDDEEYELAGVASGHPAALVA